MFLYHGSTVEIKEIDLNLSKPNKDFGRGFYLSDNFRQAYEILFTSHPAGFCIFPVAY